MADITTANDQTTEQNTTENNNQVNVDYDKIGKMINERNERTEKSVLESYFSKMGLDENGVKEAVADYKTKKASEQPDVNKINTELNDYKNQLSAKDKEIFNSKINNKAILSAIDLGINSKTIPYILKLADFSNAVNEKNEIDDEKIKESINKILEDVPQFKNSNVTTDQKKNPQINPIGATNNDKDISDLSEINRRRKNCGLKPLQ